MGTQLPLPKKGDGVPPRFSAHVHCGQTAGWIKTVGYLVWRWVIGPGHIVLDRNAVPLLKEGGGAPSPIFGPFLWWPIGWMPQDATWYGGGIDFVLNVDPAPPQKWDGAPNFRPMSIVAKLLHTSRWHLVWRYASAQATLC